MFRFIYCCTNLYGLCISCQPILKLEAPGLGALVGRLLVGTAEKIPHMELIDTTGAGDAFIGAVLYALCTDMQPEKMLPFAAQVAAGCCRAFGARTGLPLRYRSTLANSSLMTGIGIHH
ncbi:Sulfofructose kinase [Bienertia sinuspersici]